MAFDPSGLEQETLELVNRFRLHPAEELGILTNALGTPATSADPDVNAALAFFNVSGPTLLAEWQDLVAAAPLAWHESLYNAAVDHSRQMVAHDEQSHQLPGELPLGSRLRAAGYDFLKVAENVYGFGESVFHAHAAFAIDWGVANLAHRRILMNPDYREIGIGMVADSDSGTSVGPLLITQDFGVRHNAGDPYLVGVVYADANGDGFYNAGEGRASAGVVASGPAGTFSATTMTAGGYQMQVPPGTYTVTFSGGGLASALVRTATVAADNVKLDLDATELASAEATATVRALYEDVLGRTGSDDEVAYWAGVIDRGTSYLQVAGGFIQSVERRSNMVGGLYRDYLGRIVDQSGLDYWLGVWSADGGPEQVQAGIIGSPEYYQTAGGSDAAWVTALYRNILGRAVDQAGLDFWVGYIQTHTKESVVLGFVTSDEYRLGLVTLWYQDYLGRAIDEGGGQYWLGQMKLGVSQESIQIGLLASAEYRSRVGA